MRVESSEGPGEAGERTIERVDPRWIDAIARLPDTDLDRVAGRWIDLLEEEYGELPREEKPWIRSPRGRLVTLARECRPVLCGPAVRLVALTASSGGPIVRLTGVGVRRAGRWILAGLDLTIGPGERWVVVGPNGAGKTTLLAIASTYLWPTTGTVEVLGERIGRVDARELRRGIGYVSAALGVQIDEDLRVIDVVVSARDAAIAPWWATFTG